MVKRGIVLTIVLIVGILILVTLSNHNKSGVSFLTYPTNLGSNVTIDSTNLIELSNQQILSSESVQLKNGDTLKISYNDKSVYLIVGDINTVTNKVDMTLNNEKFTVNVPGEKKVDLTKDDYYDIDVKIIRVVRDRVEVVVNIIREREEGGDLVDSNVDSTLTQIQEDYKSQWDIFMYFFAFVLFLLTLYMIKVYLIPYLNLRRSLDRQKPGDTLDYLFDELNNSRIKGDKSKQKSLYSRISHLYSHMNESEKEKYRHRLREAKKRLE